MRRGEAGQVFRKALLLLDYGSLGRGEEELRRAITLADVEGDRPTQVEAMCCLGEFLCQQGRDAEAIPPLRWVAALDPSDDLFAPAQRRASELLGALSAIDGDNGT